MNEKVRAYELAIVGSMLVSERAVEEVRLRPEQMFYADTRKALEAIRKIYVKGGTPSLHSVAVELGGTDEAVLFLHSATDSIASASQVGWYVQRLLEESFGQRYREWLEADVKTFEQAQEHARTMPVFEGGTELTPISSVSLPSHLDGVSTGFSCLDRVTHGSGWVSGQMAVVSGYQKSGKTSFKTQSAVHAARLFAKDGSDRCVVYATFADLSREALLQKMLQQDCGCRYVSDSLTQAAFDELRALPIVFYDARRHGRNVEDFVSRVQGLAYKRPVGVFFADYAQKIGAKEPNPVARMESVSSRLCDLADDLHVPGVVGSQVTFNQEGEATTKYARALEEDAGLVVRIVREKDGGVFIEVPFNRHGPGQKRQEVDWDERRLSFREREYAVEDRRMGA